MYRLSLPFVVFFSLTIGLLWIRDTPGARHKASPLRSGAGCRERSRHVYTSTDRERWLAPPAVWPGSPRISENCSRTRAGCQALPAARKPGRRRDSQSQSRFRSPYRASARHAAIQYSEAESYCGAPTFPGNTFSPSDARFLQDGGESSEHNRRKPFAIPCKAREGAPPEFFSGPVPWRLRE